MSRLRLLSAAALLALAANAHASSLIVTTRLVYARRIESHLRCQFRCHLLPA